ncbi:AI-2E family transporter YdiK [Klebsiella pneumoniae]|uniref:AI-2E family transporter YdiK n=1 Tax=Klebsiella pneumoniae TaxID=573 RepID=UPI0015F74582|nr:AI-2E family transporter YdiK [Klebsiella pneumoniae]
MINPHQPRDIPQILLSVLFLALIIISCLWVVQPFILSFAWAGTVVIATWPVLLRLQRVLFGKRLLAVLAMTLLLFLLFVIPIALLVNSLVDNSVPLIKLISSGNVTLPDFAWLNSVPLVGDKLYSAWHGLLDMGGSAIMAKVRPYIGTTTSWFVGQAAHIGKLLVYCGLMLLFSALLYWRGEQVAYGFRYFLQPVWQAPAEMPPYCWRHRLSARWRWVVVTALVQAVLGGIGLPYPAYLMQRC